MKTKGKLLSQLMLLCIFGFCCSTPLFAQEKINLSAGTCLPELFNIGARYQLKQTQIGLSVGSLPLKDEQVISVSGDLYYHFAGISELSERRLWYGRLGLIYLHNETKSLIGKYLCLNTRIGKDFNITKKVGFEIDAGVIFLLTSKETRKEPANGWSLNLKFPVLPSIGLGFFYRI
jgi:hypothetical protein